MKFPYGSCDFYDIINGGYFYMDRTDRIPLIEEAGKHLLFLRPRRFGKSLLLSVLENYYDVAKAQDFDRVFGHLRIGKSPTQLHSQYLVMSWDFSAVDPQGTPAQTKCALHDHINGCIEQFKLRYRDILDYEIQLDPNNALRSFQSVLAAVQSSKYKLYLLVDEYDNFANEVLMGGESESSARYEKLLRGEGAVKTVFKAVKSATRGLGLDRAFITGVSPVVMSDITSGHNIAENISLAPEFNDLCGFSDAEVTETLERIIRECDFPAEKAGEAADMMRKFYNGYRFCQRSDGLVHNPTLALYFMKAFQKYCEYPDEMLDENLAMDRGKLAYISGLAGGEYLLTDALSGGEPLSIHRLGRRFGVEDMLRASKDRTFMISLLYYFGILTLSRHRTEIGEHVLRIPNLVIKKLYAEQIQEMLLPDTDRDGARLVAKTFCSTGDMQPLCDFMEQRYFRAFDNRDYRWANELTVKTAFLTLLFNDMFYITDSEPELGRTYSDLVMIVRPDMRQYKLLDILIEFKYVPLGKNRLTGKQVRAMDMTALAALDPVKKKLTEAKTGLAEYQQKLRDIHGQKLRLSSYAVVAVGFERLVWEKVKGEGHPC